MLWNPGNPVCVFLVWLQLTLNNILAPTARKFKLDIALIVGDTEVMRGLCVLPMPVTSVWVLRWDYLEQLVKISDGGTGDQETGPASLGLDEEATFFDCFTVERLFVFLLQLGR